MYNRSDKVHNATNGRLSSTKSTYRYRYACKKDKVSSAYLKLVGIVFILYFIIDYYVLGGM